MTKIRVALSSPIDDNLYSVLLAHECLKHEEIELVGVITLKVFSYKRFKSEFNRLRSLLFLKIFNKIFNRATSTSSFHEILKKNLFHERKISKLSLRSLCKSNEVSFRKIINPNSQESIDFLRLSQPDLILSLWLNSTLAILPWILTKEIIFGEIIFALILVLRDPFL